MAGPRGRWDAGQAQQVGQFPAEPGEERFSRLQTPGGPELDLSSVGHHLHVLLLGVPGRRQLAQPAAALLFALARLGTAAPRRQSLRRLRNGEH